MLPIIRRIPPPLQDLRYSVSAGAVQKMPDPGVVVCLDSPNRELNKERVKGLGYDVTTMSLLRNPCFVYLLWKLLYCFKYPKAGGVSFILKCGRPI